MKKRIALFLVICISLMCYGCGESLHTDPEALAEKAIDALFGYGDVQMLMDISLPAIQNDDMYISNYSRILSKQPHSLSQKSKIFASSLNEGAEGATALEQAVR